VDHFRPKAKVAGDQEPLGYWWLAYEFNNYLLSCRTCNSTYKKNKFPLVEGASRTRFETRDQIAEEARILLDPCLDTLEELVQVDLSNPLVPIGPRPNLTSQVHARVSQTLHFFGVNYQPELTKARIKIVNEVSKAIKAGTPERVRRLAIRYRPNSLVARQMLEARAPAALPTPAEELDWLMRDIYRTLDMVLKLRNAHDTDRLRNDQDELLWSFVFLLADPPYGLLGNVEAFLGDGRTRALVLEKRRQL
jgi:hypothetical protein